MLKKFFSRIGIIIFFTFLFSSYSIAQQEEVKNSEHKNKSEEEFNAGKMIVEHITDAYEWHIMEIGETIIAIPLPVILISDGKLEVFMSGPLYHGSKEYNGYKISHEGANKGKIVKMGADGTEIVPFDFSITKNVLTLFISLILLCVIFISIARKYAKNKGKAPKGLQALLEPLILFVRDDIAVASIGLKKYEKFMPYLLTIFFFIFFSNLLGLIPFPPGGANLTGNIAITLILAVFTFVITCFSANKAYWLHIINTPGVPWWLKVPLPLMPIVELMGVFTKPFVLMVRLFANITAGHIIVLGFISLIFIFGKMNPIAGYGVSVVSIAFNVFMGFLELLVAFLQAYVFTLLSALYFGMASPEEHH